MAKNLMMMGIGNQPSMPPRFGVKKSPVVESPAEQDAASYAPEPVDALDTPEPVESTGERGLKPGAQFDASVANYHDSSARCDACGAWQGEECSIWSNATDPGGWCDVFPADSVSNVAVDAVEPSSEIEELSA